MLNLLLSLSGMSKLWDALDGYKVRIAAALAIMTALGQLILAAAGLGQEVAGMLAAHQAAGLLSLLQHISANPFAQDFAKAWVLLLSSGAALGFGHKLDKHTEALQAVAQATAQTAGAAAIAGIKALPASGTIDPAALAKAGAALAAAPAAAAAPAPAAGAPPPAAGG
jgi:hypothetical protein